MEQFQKAEQNMFPLSLSQQNIWDLEQACPGTPISNISTTLRIRGRVDFAALQKSIEAVLAADASLRTRIVMQGQTPMQYQAEYAYEQFPFYDFTQTDPKGIENWENAVSREVIPLLDAPLYRFILFRIDEHEAGLLMKLHHMISDGWSQVLLCNRIGEAYLDLISGRQPSLGPSPSYEHHVQRERDYLASKAYQKDQAYWSRKIEAMGEPTVLKAMRGAAVSPIGHRKSYNVPQGLNNEIYAFCTRHRVAPFSVLYLALAIYFKRIGGEERFTIGVPIFNRGTFEEKETSGMFVSTIPFINELHEDWTMRECCDHLTEEWLDMLRHEAMPFSHIRELARKAGVEDGRLFHIALSYQNGKMQASRDASVSFSGRWHYSGYQMEQLCIHLNNRENERCYAIDYDYLTQVFTEKEIDDLHHCLMNILREGLRAPDRPVHALSVLDAAEREKVVYTFNRTDAKMYDTHLYQRFCEFAERRPNRVALICGEERITYRQMETLSERVHSALEGAGQEASLAAVLLPRSCALLAAMMGTLRAGWSFVILPLDLPVQRICEILKQSGAAVLLTDRNSCGKSGLQDVNLPVIDMEQLPAPIKKEPAESDQKALAYVVYTSGSTGVPKGVEISRGNLTNLAAAMEPVYASGAVLSLCSIGFDAFLLESVVALLNGQTILFPGNEEIESPEALAKLILRYGVGFLATTPSRLEALVKNKPFRDALHRLESLVCGGEDFPRDLLQKLQLVTQARIYNQYGPSETTVAVSLKQLNDAPVLTAGRPMPNCRLYVLDAWMNPLPVGVYGDLYIGGMSVGMGYRGAPELTEKSFMSSPFEQGDRLYRTGDTACWTAEGEIILGGRTDQQVKLHGLRVELQEISSCLQKYPGVRECTVVTAEQEGQAILAAYYTAEGDVSEGELLSFAASYLPRYMVPAAVIRMDEIPLTDHGKLDRRRLPAPVLVQEELVPPSTELERALLAIFRKVLHKDSIGIHHDYFLNGGNSLNAMETISLIAEKLRRTVRVADLYTYRNVSALSAMLEGHTAGAKPAQEIHPAPVMERYPLSPVQQGIYVQSCMDPTGRAYQMPGAFRLESAPNIARLQQAFQRLIAGEPLLRTVFLQEDDGVFAHVLPDAPFELSIFSGGTFEDASCALMEPFRLEEAPLLRAALWEDGGSWTLLINNHHIIGDGLTTAVLMRRLDTLYQGGTVVQGGLSYLDYAWQLASAQKDTAQLAYWKQRLTPLPEPVELPADHPREQNFDYCGEIAGFALGKETSERCEAYCQRHDISPYMFFLSVFGLLISDLSGREDFAVGVPAAGRTRAETRDMVGPFINTLPLRLMPCRSLRADTYLAQVRDTVNEMLDHQETGLEEMISALGLPRSMAGNPLYQVMFTQRPMDVNGFTLDGRKMTYRMIHTGTAKMDLVMEMARQEQGYTFVVEYASGIFDRETVSFWCRCFEQLAKSFLESQNPLLTELNALAPADRIKLLDTPGRTTAPFLNLPVRMQFDYQMELNPDAPAVIFHGKTTTRRELDCRACQFANLLAEAGAVPGKVIGIAMHRGSDLVAALLAIWKLGCAYAPLLADYPAQRLSYMTETAGITHILCDEASAAALPESLPCVLVQTAQSAKETFDAAALKESDLAEVLFTSGSTGKPKGVMLAWRSVCNMAEGFREILSRCDGPILCTTNVVFDMFNGEVVIPLSMGKTIVMADEEEMMLPWKLAQLIERDGARITQSTPSRVQMWFSNEVFCKASRKLELMIYGGEVLTKSLLEKAQTESGAAQVNMYGPTEGTVYNTTRPVDYHGQINIGWPMRNNRLYVLDDALKPVLPTAAGDLYLAGECVTEGYISRPDLTEAAFLDDPFFPGQRMYRTGDIARLRLDGSYDFLGRQDAQIKLNGQRVELSEIDGAMVSQNCAVQAATVPVKREDGSTTLYTYYIPASPALEHGEIRSRLGGVLPAYMIPSYFIAMDALPSTPTGKINLRQLREWSAQRETEESVPEVISGNKPADTANEPGSTAWILDIWSKVLKRDGLDAEHSFFEQGGTSLAALSVLSHYNNGGMTLSLTQFYKNPTARAQSQLMRPGAAQKVRTVPVMRKSAPAELYPRFVPDSGSLVFGEEKTVLLTGATGFLGVHILRALADEGTHVICLMRDGSTKRLRETLQWYFGDSYAGEIMDHTEILAGDLSRERLGLAEGQYQETAERIDAIWHCAADVRHYAADSDCLMRTNLGGTREMIRLARCSDAVLYHMSTTSVAGEHLKEGRQTAVFTENDFYLGQDWEENLYVRSKFLAEAAVYEAMAQGLKARIFRLGRLVGRAEDGTFQKNQWTNAFFLTMRGIHALGVLPQSMAQLPLDLTPVDWCAFSALALRHTKHTAFHLEGMVFATAEEAARAVMPEVRVVSDEEFSDIIMKVPVDEHGDLTAHLADAFHRLKEMPPNIAVTSNETKRWLEETGFQMKMPQLSRILRAFRFSSSECLMRGEIKG